MLLVVLSLLSLHAEERVVGRVGRGDNHTEDLKETIKEDTVVGAVIPPDLHQRQWGPGELNLSVFV